jgi:hypothetical protein
MREVVRADGQHVRVRVVGPAVGGILVVALSPGWALAVDSASFFPCAALLARMRIPARAAGEPSRFLHELRAGWREFTARTWLWTTVLLFGLGNVVFMFLQVLGPAIADARLGGAGAWAAILTAGGVGAIVGGFGAMRHRPRRPLVPASCGRWPSCPSSRRSRPARRRRSSPSARSAAASASRSTSRCGSRSSSARSPSAPSRAWPPTTRLAPSSSTRSAPPSRARSQQPWAPRRRCGSARAFCSR